MADGSGGVVTEENRGRNRYNVEMFYVRTIFRLAKPAFFRYNENYALERDLFVTDFGKTGNT